MASTPEPELSPQAKEVLLLLRRRHNVLLTGAPATGKTRLLSEIAAAFKWTPGPGYEPEEPIPLPATSTTDAAWLPSAHRKDREVFTTVFDQSTKVRDVLRGLVPVVATESSVKGLRFRIHDGVLFQAAEYAVRPDGAALLIVDEINRGPAVAAFGPSLVALESDKRLADDGSLTNLTQTFRLLGDDGAELDYALPTHLYVLAAMNQADTSVEALDVAFLRRFSPYRLLPDTAPAFQHLGITDSLDAPLLETPQTSDDVYRALARAWKKINTRIHMSRGEAYQIGHGVLMTQPDPPDELAGALEYARHSWDLIRQHVDEIYFNDTRTIAAVLSAGADRSPLTLEELSFAGQPVLRIGGLDGLAGDRLHLALVVIADSD